MHEFEFTLRAFALWYLRTAALAGLSVAGTVCAAATLLGLAGGEPVAIFGVAF